MKTLNQLMLPIIADAFAAANASATLFNTIAAQWSEAKRLGYKPKDFKAALVSALTDEGPYVTTQYEKGKPSERACYPKGTINKYLLAIDESAFRERAKRSDNGKKKVAPKVSLSQLQVACVSAGLTKAQIKALFAAL